AVHEVAVAPAGQAVEILGVERALVLLARVLPVPLNLIELIEAADAATGRSHLPAVGGLTDVGRAILVALGIAVDAAAGDPAPAALADVQLVTNSLPVAAGGRAVESIRVGALRVGAAVGLVSAVAVGGIARLADGAGILGLVLLAVALAIAARVRTRPVEVR